MKKSNIDRTGLSLRGLPSLCCLFALLPLAACGAPEDVEGDSEPLGTIEQANRCGDTDDYQNVEFYDGTYGVSTDMVDNSEGPVAHVITHLGECSGTLIARNILLTAGHCETAVGDKVRFDDQLTITGFPRTPVIFTVDAVLAQKNDVGSFPEINRGDYALVQLSGAPASTFGYLRIANEEARTVALSNQPLALIGFPAQAPQGPNFKVLSTGPYASASAQLLPNWFGAQLDTIGGSSGGSILRRDGQIVGLHTTAGCGPTSGNNNMRTPVLFRDVRLIRQIAAMQGVNFANIDGLNGVDAIAVNFNRIAARTSNGTQFANQTNWTAAAYFGNDGTFFADVTGDKKADAIVLNAGQIVVRRSSGTSFGANETWLDVNAGTLTPMVFADFTGDGRADAVQLSSSTTFVRPATNANNFGPNQLWTGLTGTLATLVGDVDGNGAMDLVAVNDDKVRVITSKFTGFNAPKDWITTAFYGAYGTFLADVTGDKKADLIVVNNGATTVRRSTGTTFGPSETWLSSTQFGSLGMTFADADGDGKADFIAVNPNGVTVRKSSGTAFGASQSWISVPYYGAL